MMCVHLQQGAAGRMRASIPYVVAVLGWVGFFLLCALALKTHNLPAVHP